MYSAISVDGVMGYPAKKTDTGGNGAGGTGFITQHEISFCFTFYDASFLRSSDVNGELRAMEFAGQALDARFRRNDLRCTDIIPTEHFLGI